MALTFVRTESIHGAIEEAAMGAFLNKEGLAEMLERPERQCIKSTVDKDISLLPVGAEGSKEILLIKQYRQTKYAFWPYRWAMLGRRVKQFEVLEYCAVKGVPLVRQYGVFFLKQDERYRFVSIFQGLLGCQNLAVLARDEPAKFDVFVQEGGLSRVVALIANMHRLGVIHKDLKWSNLLVDEQGSVRLVDTDHLTRVGTFGFRKAVLKDFSRFVVGAYEANFSEPAIKQLIGEYGKALALEGGYVRAAITPRVKVLLLRKGISSEIF